LPYPDPTWDNIDTTNGKIRIQDCDGFDDDIYATAAVVMETFETSFKCGSWCEESGLSPVYYFTNINDVPNQFCYTALEKSFEEYGIIFGSLFIVTSTVSILSVILTCCICYHHTRDRHTYQRFENVKT